MRFLSLCASLAIIFFLNAEEALAASSCPPTPADAVGPFYKPDAPVRSKVGTGHVLSGTVRSAKDCSPVKGARVELWLVSPDGDYDDDRRATIIADDRGAYRFESNFPLPYSGRPPHIHIKVTAAGFRQLVTQHYPEKGKKESVLGLVLVPAR